jgi:hypothetical protein
VQSIKEIAQVEPVIVYQPLTLAAGSPALVADKNLQFSVEGERI